MFEFIISSLQAYINANVPEVKHIDVYGSAIESIHSGEKEAVARPAIFINLSEPFLVDGRIGNQKRILSGIVTLVVVVDVVGGLIKGASQLQSNLKAIGVSDKIFKGLNGLNEVSMTDTNEEGDYNYLIGNFNCINRGFGTADKSLMESTISFEFTIEDNSMVKREQIAEIEFVETEITFM